MLYNYLITTIRNFKREGFFTLINLLGLSFGLAVSLTILLFIYHEFSYDRDHPDVDQTYRLAMRLSLGGKEASLNSTHPPLASAIKDELPSVAYATRVEIQDGMVFAKGEILFEENRVAVVDQDFLRIFSVKWLEGDRELALTEPHSVVLTEELATKYFGTGTAVGELITINRTEYRVTGLIESPSSNTHIRYRALISLKNSSWDKDISWNNINISTYVTAARGTDPQNLVQDVQNLFQQRSGYDPDDAQGMKMEYFAQPLRDIHLHSHLDGEFEPNGNISVIYLFLAIGTVILLLACVNFMNLSTARSIYRAREVGIRKVLGSSRSGLRLQFLFESVSMTFLSMLLALGFTELIRIPLSGLLNHDLNLVDVLGPYEVFGLIAFTLLVGLLAGSYPAFFLSSFDPSDVLKGKLSAGNSGGRLRNLLVVLQFVISCTLITATLLFNDQVTFLRSKSLGFDRENVLEIGNARNLPDQEVFLDKLVALNGISSASSSAFGPVDDYDGTQMHRAAENEKFHLVNMNWINDQYLNTLGMQLVKGRNFNRELSGDSAAVIINQTAADMIFPGGEPLEDILQMKGGDTNFKVIGVVSDFNFESLTKNIMPLVFFYSPSGRTIQVRLEPGNYARSVALIENLWRENAPDTPFSYNFLDERYEQLYQSEMRMGRLIGSFTIIAIVIACLGLLGLAAYMTERRNKEIGIRKALGASVSGIVKLLTLDFVRIVMVGFLLSVPISYYLIARWLENYAYRIEPGWISYGTGGCIALLIALATVGYQALKAAKESPVNTLKSD